MSVELSKALRPIWDKLELGRLGAQKTKAFVPAAEDVPLADGGIQKREKRRRINTIFEGDAGNVYQPGAGA